MKKINIIERYKVLDPFNHCSDKKVLNKFLYFQKEEHINYLN